MRFNVYLTTLMKAKGFMEVLRCVPLVLQEEPQVRFVLAGELCYPEEIREAQDFINRNQLHDFVRMPGVVVGDEKAQLLYEADVFVFPPITPEGQAVGDSGGHVGRSARDCHPARGYS